MNTSSTTDWIQAICAILGVIGVIITAIKLFQKDKQREDQISELRQQGAQLIEQNNLIRAANNDFRNYFDFIVESSTKSSEIQIKQHQFEENKRKKDVQPHIKAGGLGFQGETSTFGFSLTNYGETALNLIVSAENTDVATMTVSPTTLRKGERADISATLTNNQAIINYTLGYIVSYIDYDGRKYRQKGVVSGPSRTVDIFEPEETK